MCNRQDDSSWQTNDRLEERVPQGTAERHRGARGV